MIKFAPIRVYSCSFAVPFSQLEVARDFLAHYLPQPVTAVLDLDTLRLQPDNFVDPDLQEQFADLLYRIKLRDGQEAYVYALLEHKSYPDPATPFQLLRYLVRIWERDQRNKEPLRPIIPLVVYHGEETWRIPTDFAHLFAAPEALRPYWPQFHYELQDLGALSDEQIRGQAQLQIGLLILKYIFDPNLRHRLGDIFALFRELAETRTALEYLKTVLYYMGNASRHLQPDDVVKAVQQLMLEGGDQVVQTLADYWIEQGIEQERQRRLAEKRAIARKLLTLHNAVTVSELVELPLEEVLALAEEMKNDG